jgi:hypothetical protein
MELSLSKIAYTSLPTNDFAPISYVHITILSPLDIQDDIRPMNSLHEIIGGLACKHIYVNILMDANPAKELEFIEINPTIPFTLTRYPRTHGNISQPILLDHYQNQMDLTPFWL